MPIRLLTFTKGAKLPDIPGSSLFQSVELFHVYENTPGYTPILMVAYDGNRPVAKLLAVIQRGSRWLPGAWTNRCQVYEPGEYFDNNIDKAKLFGMMLNHLTNLVLPNTFIIEFRNITKPLFAYKEFRDNLYFPVNWMRVYNSLHNKDPEERLYTSRKRQIQKGFANGATVKTADSIEEVKSFVTMLKRIYSSKILRHFPDINFFIQLVKLHPEKEKARLFIVYYKEKIIGGSLCAFSNGTAYLWFSGGMRKTHKIQYPGVLAVWAAIHYSYKHNYQHFEFMNVGVPFRLHGYREFILRFGGKERSTRRWFRFRWKWLNKLATWFYL